MAQVYLIAVPEDAEVAGLLAEALKRLGHITRTEFGKFGYPPARRDEVTFALWSRAALMSLQRLQMTNRAIDAWEDGRLVMARLDHGLSPHGLGDVDLIDLSFEAARRHRIGEIDREIRERAAPRPAEALGPAAPGGPAGPRHDIFVSYAHDDADTVYPLVPAIEAGGHEVWIDREGIRSGQTWAGAIVRAIKSASLVCLMCSARAFASDHVRREVYLADKYRKGLLPVRLDTAEMPEDIEYFLAGVQWVDLAGADPNEHAERVRRALSI